MHFIHKPYQKEDTIAAVATPPGEGGIAVIRISGKEALGIAEKIYTGPLRSYKSHTAHCGSILGKEGNVVDDVLILPMLAPRSYTGEDTVEIHCHGGVLLHGVCSMLFWRQGLEQPFLESSLLEPICMGNST
ncbi:MAG: hypothetical protein LVR00_09295 [Rhabdochlamydiaceae bacterium]|jgi:tRNA modification GTPase